MQSPLKKWREAKNLTQQELGTALGVSRTTIQPVEDGQKSLTGRLRERLLGIDRDVVLAQDQYFEQRKAEITGKLGTIGGDTA